MPTFFLIEGVKIEFFFNDHLPEHFHASIAEYEALVAIRSIEIFRGSLPRNKTQLILTWAEQNQEMLLEIWQAMRNR